MTDAERDRKINELYDFMESLRSFASIPHDVDRAFTRRLQLETLQDLPDNLGNAPLALVTSPSGGATVDSQARTAIDAIITRLEDLGLISPN